MGLRSVGRQVIVHEEAASLVQSPIRRRNDGVRRDFDSVEVCGLFQGAAAEL